MHLEALQTFYFCLLAVLLNHAEEGVQVDQSLY